MGRLVKAGSERRVNPVVVAYLLHLLVPLGVLVDVCAAWSRGEIQFSPAFPHTVIAAAAALWLGLGLGLLFLSRNWRAFGARVSNLLLTIYTLYLLSAVAEVFGRWIGLVPYNSALQPPLTRSVVVADASYTPGTSGLNKCTINALGLRGPMPPKRPAVYRIVAIGGSTTICNTLDDSEEWPHVLMNYLNDAQVTTPVWIGNAGMNGRNTVGDQVVMQWLPGILHFDLAVFLIGGSDFAATLTFNGTPTQKILERKWGFQGDLPQGARSRFKYPIYARLRLFTLLEIAAQNVRGRWENRNVARPSVRLEAFRKRRAEGPVLPLPDLSTGLLEYRNRIEKLANQCRNLQVRCLFLTEPKMWRADLRPDELRLVWAGPIGSVGHPNGYVSVSDLARGMRMYNRALLDACRELGLECFDIAPHIPKNTTAFFDGEHFNEAGAKLFAQVLGEYLLSKPPFAGQANRVNSQLEGPAPTETDNSRVRSAR